MGTQNDRRCITDTAQDTACVIGGLNHLPVLHTERIVILGPLTDGNFYAVTDLHCLDCTDGHDRFA